MLPIETQTIYKPKVVMNKTIHVVAALIQDASGKFLICQRPANKARALLWEFVGGKVELGESPRDALVRECIEELAIIVHPTEVFCDLTHEYDDVTVHLTLFLTTITSGTPQKLEHNDIRWVTATEMQNYHFCPADYTILQKIAQQFA